MKILIPMLLSGIWFLNCSYREGDLQTAVKTADTSNAVGGSILDTGGIGNSSFAESKIIVSNRNLQTGNFQVDFYEDNELVSSTYYSYGRIFKVITYNTLTKKREIETRYFYKENGDIERVEVIAPERSEAVASEFKKIKKDLHIQLDVLESKGIRFQLPDIAEAEVRDLSTIFSIADNYSDFKTETKNHGKLRTISLLSFNKRIRFNYSAIPYLIGLSEEVINDTILIKEYKLTLENRLPLKEIYTTGNGELTKTYSYNDGKLIRIVYQFTNIENRTNSLDKRFEYHELH